LDTHTKLALLLAAALGLAAAACNSTPPVKTDAELGLNPPQAHGRALYDQHCLVCHEAYSRSDRNGPSLMGLYKKQFMVSGQPVNDDRVRDIINMGKPKMPAYGSTLSAQDLDDLMAYMKTL
jgi:mono/diheme cytochrome c family protein